MKEIWKREDRINVNSDASDNSIDCLLYIVFTYNEELTADTISLSDLEMFDKFLLEV